MIQEKLTHIKKTAHPDWDIIRQQPGSRAQPPGLHGQHMEVNVHGQTHTVRADGLTLGKVSGQTIVCQGL